MFCKKGNKHGIIKKQNVWDFICVYWVGTILQYNIVL